MSNETTRPERRIGDTWESDNGRRMALIALSENDWTCDDGGHVRDSSLATVAGWRLISRVEPAAPTGDRVGCAWFCGMRDPMARLDPRAAITPVTTLTYRDHVLGILWCSPLCRDERRGPVGAADNQKATVVATDSNRPPANYVPCLKGCGRWQHPKNLRSCWVCWNATGNALQPEDEKARPDWTPPSSTAGAKVRIGDVSVAPGMPAGIVTDVSSNGWVTVRVDRDVQKGGMVTVGQDGRLVPATRGQWASLSSGVGREAVASDYYWAPVMDARPRPSCGYIVPPRADRPIPASISQTVLRAELAATHVAELRAIFAARAHAARPYVCGVTDWDLLPDARAGWPQ